MVSKGRKVRDRRVGSEEHRRRFEELLERALDLHKRCTEGMGVMMNRVVVAESRKAIDQEERLKRFAPAGIVLYPFVIYQLTIRNELQGIRSGSPVCLAFCW